MKRVIIFGLGDMGKRLVRQIGKYARMISVVAICDNNLGCNYYEETPVISPEEIKNFEFEEIWIATVYYESIIAQLQTLGIVKEKCYRVEPVVPILEERIREILEENGAGSLFPGEIDDEVLAYISNHKLSMYPYPFYDEYYNNHSQIFYDETADLYYGIYNNMRLYLAKRHNSVEKARAYFNSVVMEQDSRSPHCYWNDNMTKSICGNVVDVGAAEGIFGLKIIDQVEHIYMIEADPEWIEALGYTFKGYEKKITIISEFVGDGRNGRKMDELFLNTNIHFIKMDIEGMELSTLKGAERVIESNRPSLAVCVYHQKDDNKQISQWIKKRGYTTRNSRGVVLCVGDWELDRDETGFRKALLFAN